MTGIAVCYSGLETDAERALAPIRRLGTPLVDSVRAMDYVALQRSGDTDDPRARAAYLKSGFLPDLPADLVSAVVDGFEGDPGRTTIVAYQQGGGAINRVANDATAFTHRDAAGNLLVITNWAFGDDPTEHVAWTRRYWASLEPFSQGFYTNDMGPDLTAATINRNYRENYPRLVRIKNVYDPGHLFHLNDNVE